MNIDEAMKTMTDAHERLSKAKLTPNETSILQLLSGLMGVVVELKNQINLAAETTLKVAEKAKSPPAN